MKFLIQLITGLKFTDSGLWMRTRTRINFSFNEPGIVKIAGSLGTET